MTKKANAVAINLVHLTVLANSDKIAILHYAISDEE